MKTDCPGAASILSLASRATAGRVDRAKVEWSWLLGIRGEGRGTVTLDGDIRNEGWRCREVTRTSLRREGSPMNGKIPVAEIRIVIAQRGWVFVGRVSRESTRS